VERHFSRLYTTSDGAESGTEGRKERCMKKDETDVRGDMGGKGFRQGMWRVLATF
jgi:hypothetical protein